MMQDLTVEQYSTWKDQCSSTCIGDTIVIMKNTTEMQPQTAYLIFEQLVIVSFFANVSLPKIADLFPIKKLFCKLGNSYQTYITFHKTHAMATHYGGIEDTSMNNPESHDMDSGRQDNYQEDVNDLEHIELNPPVKLKHLTHEMEQLRQTVEDKDNDPMDAIKHLEQKLNQLAITLCPPTEPIREVLNKYTNTLCNAQKKMSLENSLLQDIPILNGNDSSQLEDWLTDIETASELTGESRTKLVQAKSRGLVRTLI